MREPVKITISNRTKAEIRRGQAIVLGCPIFAVCLGILMDSAAMQWLGFLLSTIVIFALAAKASKKNDQLTIDQARVRLDEIEKENK